MEDECAAILKALVEAHQRIHERALNLAYTGPEAISPDDVDRSYIALMGAKLELARHQAGKIPHL